MANWKRFIEIGDIEIEINFLRNLMQDCVNSLPNSHSLYKLFQSFNKWKLSGKPDSIPNDVLILATYSKSIKLFRNDFKEQEVKSHLTKRLCDVNLVPGVLFEFRSCVHFDNYHNSVNWLRNIGQDSEADIRIIHKNGQIFYIECTSRRPKLSRLSNYSIVKSDTLNAVRRKKNQCRDLAFPRLLAVFFPEGIDLKNDSFRLELCCDLRKRFEQTEYNSISAVTIVSNIPPDVKLSKNNIIIYDTDLLTLTYPNKNAKYPLPAESINPGGL